MHWTLALPMGGVRRRLRVALAGSSLLLLSGAALWAQTPGTGSLRGRVLDETGAPVAAVKVAVANQATGFTRAVESDARGLYSLPELPLTGGYRIRFEHAGFGMQEKADIQLRSGETASIDAVLHPSPVESAITVFGTAEGIRSDSPQLGTRFDALKIRETPVLGGKLTSLPLVNSAVRPARGTGDLFLNNTLFVIDGGGRRQTTFTIDGGTADDAWGRQTIFTNVPLAALQEFTVLTNGFSAEYGRTTGGAINVVTRSGTNAYRGDLIAVNRPGGLQADAPVTKLKARDELWQGSAFLSGPLVHDRAYWAVGGEYNRQNRDSIITSPLQPGTFTGHYHQSLFFARVDDDLNPQNHLQARANVDDFTDTNPADAVGGIALPSAARTFRRNATTAQVGETAVLSTTLFNDARLVYEDGDPITEFEPANPSIQFSRPGVSTEGESRSAHLTNRQTQLADTLSMTFGNHLLKLGGDVARSRSGGDGQEFGTPFVLGQFTFKAGIPATTPTSNLTINDVQRFTQGFGNVHYSVSETLSSLFAQDDFRVRPDLVLNFGLRYDKQSLTDDDSNLSPRLGFAWSPGGDPRTTVRGSYSRFYSELHANIVATWVLGGPTGFFNFSAAPGQLGFPTSLQPLAGFPPGAVLPPRDVTIRPGDAAYYSQFFDVSKLAGYPSELHNPRTDQVTLGAERRLGGSWFLSGDVVHSDTKDIERNLDLNAPSLFVRTTPGQTRSGAAADATRPIVPVAGGYRRILVTVNDGEGKYDALQLNLRRDFDGKAALLLSYTWSHTRNNVEPDAPGGDPGDVQLLDKEWADSILDQRHRVVLSGWASLPFGLVGGGNLSFASGRPYNITTGADNNGDGGNTDRPVIDGHVIGRNAGRGHSLADLALFLERDLQLSGPFTLRLRAEVFNLTNHQNAVGYNGVYGNNTNGQPLSTFGLPVGGINSVDPGRQFQFQARVSF